MTYALTYARGCKNAMMQKCTLRSNYALTYARSNYAMTHAKIDIAKQIYIDLCKNTIVLMALYVYSFCLRPLVDTTWVWVWALLSVLLGTQGW